MSSAPPKSAAKAVPASTTGTRSPFVRLTELITGIEPGKPPINLTVGEPQHPIPPFVAEIVQRSLNLFGRYPPTKGYESVRRAAPRGSRTASRSAAPSTLKTNCWCSTARAKGCFFAALTARTSYSGPHGTPRDSDAEPVLRRLCGGRSRRRLRTRVSARDPGYRFSSRPRCAR